MSETRITRRAFLGGTAASAAWLVVPRHVLGGPGDPAPSDKLNVACIGCGGKGRGDVGAMAGENIVALCDVDEKRAAPSYKRFEKTKKFKDFRVMLRKMDKAIDAVTISTPDHIHAPASMMAMRMGKHVFCQKPLTHSIHEARTLALAARKYDVCTQMGIQGHAFDGPRLVKEWVEAGWLGQVREVWYWTNRPIWPQNLARPEKTDPVPDHLDWDLWLGPAPQRPYVDKAYQPFRWRGWWDFGSGALGDIACHAMDAAYYALELGYPESVEAEAGPMTDESPPNWSRITIHFPPRGERAGVKVVWNDGYEKNQRPQRLAVPRPEELEPDRKLPRRIGGQLIVGDEATVMAGIYCRSPRVIPESKMRDLLKNHKVPKTIPRVPGQNHYQEWLRGCKGGPRPGASFDTYAGPLTEMVLIGNLAVRTGQKVQWDAERMRSTNVPEANRFVRREYRQGWTL
ncbi:MAG: Gfo/Idh/MocA family protein [Candidatus Brocadiia bacterium]